MNMDILKLTRENAQLFKNLIEAAMAYAHCDVDDLLLAKKTEDDLHKAAVDFALDQGRAANPLNLSSFEAPK